MAQAAGAIAPLMATDDDLNRRKRRGVGAELQPEARIQGVWAIQTAAAAAGTPVQPQGALACRQVMARDRFLHQWLDHGRLGRFGQAQQRRTTAPALKVGLQ